MYDNQEHMTLGDWIITFLILFFVPCVNVVMLFVWAFGTDVNPSKKTFCQALLIFWAIGFLIYVLFFITVLATGFSHSGAHGAYGMIQLLLPR